MRIGLSSEVLIVSWPRRKMVGDAKFRRDVDAL
jgi:hypothetical protein